MSDELKAEVERVSKIISETHHAACAAIFMGGTGKELIAKRDRLLAQVRKACLATDENRPQALADLRAVAE